MGSVAFSNLTLRERLWGYGSLVSTILCIIVVIITGKLPGLELVQRFTLSRLDLGLLKQRKRRSICAIFAT